MKIKTTRRVTHTVTIDDETEVIVTYQPYDERDILVHKVGNKMVVVYLVHDEAPGLNPMVDYDGQGKLYLRREGTIDDNEQEVYEALGLDPMGWPDIYKTFELEGRYTSLEQLAINKLNPGALQHEIEEQAYALYPSLWETMAGPYVLPVDYQSQSYTIIDTRVWDGDVNRLPSGVWVANDDAIANLAYGDKVPTRDEVIAYASAVLTEYAEWCSGNVFGCVVETFELQGGQRKEWVAVDEDACWSQIGHDYAKETLKSEFFEPAVKAIGA